MHCNLRPPDVTPVGDTKFEIGLRQPTRSSLEAIGLAFSRDQRDAWIIYRLHAPHWTTTTRSSGLQPLLHLPRNKPHRQL